MFISSDALIPENIDSVCFHMDTDHFTRTLSYSTLSNGKISSVKIHTTLENVNYLCDEGLKKGKRFTGALVGMYAVRDTKELTAFFHHEEYEDLI